ncbi:MAG: hypothetical protein NT027_01315 [Proteobacteria bacterium]|nr:hypothetical protein [Pseudomonadota bacterium]
MRVSALHCFRLLGILTLSSFLSCSKAPSGGSEAPAKSKKPKATKDTGDDASSSDKSEGTAGKPCWEKVLQTEAAKACQGIYAYSSASCAINLKKDASCSKEIVAAKYGNATLEGKPASATLDQWASDGFEFNQCSTGSDGKLYVYLIKKVFTAGEGTASDSYSISDKKLGPSGALLDSINLKSGGKLQSFSCDDDSASPSGSPSPSASPNASSGDLESM